MSRDTTVQHNTKANPREFGLATVRERCAVLRGRKIVAKDADVAWPRDLNSSTDSSSPPEWGNDPEMRHE